MYLRKSVLSLLNFITGVDGGHHSQEDGQIRAIAAERSIPYRKPTRILVEATAIRVVAVRHEAPCECTCARAKRHATAYAAAMPTTGGMPHAPIPARHAQNAAAPTHLCCAQARQCRQDCLAVIADVADPIAWHARSTTAPSHVLDHFQHCRCLRTASRDASRTPRRAAATRAKPAPRLLRDQTRLFRHICALSR
jgi:hypothetical protein